MLLIIGGSHVVEVLTPKRADTLIAAAVCEAEEEARMVLAELHALATTWDELPWTVAEELGYL